MNHSPEEIEKKLRVAESELAIARGSSFSPPVTVTVKVELDPRRRLETFLFPGLPKLSMPF